MTSIARKLYQIFFEGCTHFSVARINSSGNLAYYTEEGIPSLEIIEQHIQGEVVLGAYTVLPGNKVRWMAFDVDSKADPEKAKEIARKLCDFLGGVNYIIEWSGNKGYHILIFFDTEVPAVEAKQVGEAIREVLQLPKTGDPHVEVFPKQAELTDTNPRGSLLRLPLGRHPTTHNWTMFVDPSNGWEQGPEQDAEKLLDVRVSLTALKGLLSDADPITQVLRILQPYWVSGQRHDLALYTSGHLATLGWTEEAVEEVIRTLAQNAGEGDPENQLECVRNTFERIAQGKSVMGFHGLSEMLPSATLHALTTAASAQTFSATLQVIDRIRLGKSVAFQKVRTAAKTIVAYLKENGMLVQDQNWAYWLDGESRDLYSIGSKEWERLLHNQFGLNSLESFGKQVTESVRQFVYQEAEWVKVEKRAFWHNNRLLINLGGAEVYVISGDWRSLRVIRNGEEGVLFLNTEDPLNLPNLMATDVERISALEFLTKDLYFSENSDNVSATPEQQTQLLKAWILSVFFAQALPTRPILTLLAPSGAGKTTAARRVLRLIEGPDEDVLGVVSDKPDALRSSLAAHKVLVLDNLEKTKAHWLTDVLNRVSTGSHIEIRTLYKTNDMQKIIPNCYVIITATEMPFSEETVYTRMLPLELDEIARGGRLPEGKMQSDMMNNYLGLWKGLLYELNQVVAELRQHQEVEVPNDSRLADFTYFCARIRNAECLDGKALMDGLQSMVSRQREILRSNSPFIQVLETWLRNRPEDAAAWCSASELHARLGRVASANRIEWRWQTAQGLARHISALESSLVKHYRMQVRSRRESGREVREYRFKPEKPKTEGQPT